MNTMEAIRLRRSIRKYKSDPVSDDLIRQVLQAGILAPSGSNRQPWHFYIVKENRRDEMITVMNHQIEEHRLRGDKLGSSENSTRIMSQAPVTIFIFNPQYENHSKSFSQKENLRNVVDVQSVGAAIQNMNLAAVELGLGVLWICDVFQAYDELCSWLGETHQMVAALSLGYADESPDPRPRKSLDEVTTWL